LLSALTCGSDHDPECLCDIKITQTTTISAELTLGSVYADYIFRAFGEDMLDNPGGLLDFLEALAQAKDDITPTTHRELTLTEERDIIVDYLRAIDTSILDVELDLGFTVDYAVSALCYGRPSIIRTFDDLRWLEIEAILDEHPKIGSTKFATLAGLTRSSARSILGYYR
jgi:hypothetical protein